VSALLCRPWSGQFENPEWERDCLGHSQSVSQSGQTGYQGGNREVCDTQTGLANDVSAHVQGRILSAQNR